MRRVFIQVIKDMNVMLKDTCSSPSVLGNGAVYRAHLAIEYRLRTLIAKGDVRYKGDLSSMRLYEVKC